MTHPETILPPPTVKPALEAFLARVNRRPRVWLTVIALLLALQISPWWYSSDDGCLYLSIARSLVQGDQVTAYGTPQVIAAPGYVLLISPAFLFGERPFLAISILHWFLAVAAMFGVYHWARRQFPSVAVLITALVMLNMAVWLHYRSTMKELAFMTVLVWAVNALEVLFRGQRQLSVVSCQLSVASGPLSVGRSSAMNHAQGQTDIEQLTTDNEQLTTDQEQLTKRNTALTVLAAILLIIALAMIRYPGIVLVAGFGVALAWRAWNGRMSWTRAVVLGLAVGVPPSAVLLGYIRYERQLAQVHGGQTYEAGFRRAVADIENKYLESLRLRISSMGRITIPGMFKAYSRRGEWLDVNMAVYVLWLVPLAMGWWRLAKHKGDVLALSLPFYLGLYLAWPFDQGARFLAPMTPLLMACVWLGLNRIFVYRRCFLGMLVVAHFGVAAGYWVFIDAPRAWAEHQQWPDADRLANIIRNDLRPIDVADGHGEMRRMLMFTVDRLMHPYELGQPVPPDTRWLVVPKDATVDGPLAVVEVAGAYKLLRREAPE